MPICQYFSVHKSNWFNFISFYFICKLMLSYPPIILVIFFIPFEYSIELAIMLLYPPLQYIYDLLLEFTFIRLSVRLTRGIFKEPFTDPFKYSFWDLTSRTSISNFEFKLIKSWALMFSIELVFLFDSIQDLIPPSK